MSSDSIPVLDRGYVRLDKHMGDDLDVVNSAKVSFLKSATTLGGVEEGLIRRLIEEGHTSTLRHSAMTFEVKAPLMVARQWWKYVVGHTHDPLLGWNEASRRYVTREPEFYIPKVWRQAAETRRQGSLAEPVDDLTAQIATTTLNEAIHYGVNAYQWALRAGVCAEQARGYLPANFQYTTWRWTCSLQGCLHFLAQRLEPGAQSEIREYAAAVRDLAQPLFPNVFAFAGVSPDA